MFLVIAARRFVTCLCYFIFKFCHKGDSKKVTQKTELCNSIIIELGNLPKSNDGETEKTNGSIKSANRTSYVSFPFLTIRQFFK